MISKLVMYGYSFFVWPVAFFFRNEVREMKEEGRWFDRVIAYPYWIVLDDEEDYGEDWWLRKHGYGRNWRTAWIWSWARNNSWNWNMMMRVHEPVNMVIVVRSWSTDGRNPALHRRFKWEQRREDGSYYGDWNTNDGDRLSQYRTWLGSAFCVYQVSGGRRKYWRFSSARIYGPIMVNVKVGYNDRGEALLDVKLKKFKKEYTEHWV